MNHRAGHAEIEHTRAFKKVCRAVVTDEVAGEEISDIEVWLPIWRLLQDPRVQNGLVHAAYFLQRQMLD